MYALAPVVHPSPSSSALREAGNLKTAPDFDGWGILYGWLSWPSCQAPLAANFELCVQLDVHLVDSPP